MKKFPFFFLWCSLLSSIAVAQQGNGNKLVTLYEDFESGMLPAGWLNTFGAATNGWQFGSDLSSAYWNIPLHSSYAGVNDDACNCDMSAVDLTTPSFSTAAGASSLEFDYVNYSSGDVSEVQISVNGGITFTTLETLAGSGGAWIDNYVIDLSAYSSANTLIRFHYSDAGQWAWGFCIDNVEITSPGTDDLAVTGISPAFGVTGNSIHPIVSVFNAGVTMATDYSVNLRISQGSIEVYNEDVVMSGQSLMPATDNPVEFVVPFLAPTAGLYTMNATVQMVNDANAANNSNSTSMNVISIPPYTDFAYAINSVDKSFNSVDLLVGTLDSISNFNVTDFPMCLEFINNVLYVFRASGDVEVIYSDGTPHPLGSISGLKAAPTAATYCELNGKTYVVDFNDTVSTLYELDLNSFQATEIGICDSGVFIAIEATPVGAIYGVNISDDNLYTIDRFSGASTMIGSTGLALSFGQDISWDSNSNTLYGMLYDESQGGIFGTFNTSDGTFNAVSFPGDQIAAFAVNSAWTYLAETPVQPSFLFPNPANDFFTLTLHSAESVTISDLSGRLVYFLEVDSDTKIPVGNLDAGVYIVTCKAINGSFSEMLVIQ